MAKGEAPDHWRDEDEWPPEFIAMRKQRMAKDNGLSLRRYEVLLMIANGIPDVDIARQTCRSVRAIQSDVVQIRRKLGARNRAHAVAIAARKDLIV